MEKSDGTAPIGCVIEIMRSVGTFLRFGNIIHALPIAMCGVLLYVVVNQNT